MKHFINRTLIAAMMLGASVTAVEMTNAQVATQRLAVQQSAAKPQLTVEQRVEKRLDQMKKNLQLSEAQVAQLRAILREDMNEFKNARMAIKNADTKDARQAARLEFKAQAQTTKDRIAAVLNPEQLAKMEAKLKDRRQDMKERMHDRREKKRDMKKAHKQEMKQDRKENK